MAAKSNAPVYKGPVPTSFLLPHNNDSSVKPVKGSWRKGAAENHTTPASITLEAILSTGVVKPGEALVSNHSVVSKVLKESLTKETSNTSSKGNLSSISSGSSSSASSVGKEKDSSSHSSAETSLPVISKPKTVNDSHFMGKSISLDEQDSAQNGLASSTSQQPPVRMSTPQPQKSSKLGDREKTATVNQKSFGGAMLRP